jgi:hypothetical protein
MAISKTLSPENQFLFTCPVFKVNTKIASCLELRELVWRGEKPAVRFGCQVAMHADKCPVPRIVRKMIRMQDDPYHSTEAKVGSIQQVILDEIAPVLVMDRHIDESAATDLEKIALHKCNKAARAGEHMTTKSREYKKPTAPKKAAVAPAPKVSDATITAAATGDLSAALNTETAL